MTTKPVSNDTLLQQLRWRYATKKFDPTKKISPEDWDTLEQALVLTPSSFGLQPWKFLVVQSSELREKLVPHSWGQRQLVDASHIVVFAIKKHVGHREIEAHIKRVAQIRHMDLSALEPYQNLMVSKLVEGPISLNINAWASRQAYIALGNVLISAAMLGIDTCALEGIEPEKYDEILGLTKQNLATVVACALGYRAADDKYATAQKVRYSRSEVIEIL
jgi:nitroreductase